MDQKTLFVFLLCETVAVHSFHTIITEFYFVNIAMTWQNARQYCRDHYTDLATFRNMDDIDSVTRPIYSYAWIGLFDDPASWQGVMTNDSTSWRWSATEAPSSSRYMKWSVGNPSNSGPGETCVDIYQGQWNDYPCNYALYFACFKNTNDSSSKQFILVSILLSWEDARSYCRQQYTDLAMIEDETENSAVAALLWGGAVWIGLYREGWKWSDGSNSTFKNWANGQPDLGLQNCVVETTARDWHDGGCDASYPFICQKVVKKKLSKVQLKLQTWADLSDPANTALIIPQLFENLKQKGITDIRMQWILRPQYSGMVAS